MTSQTPTVPTTPETPPVLEPKKWAGKFESPEQLEEAYKNSSSEAVKLKKSVDEKEAKLKEYDVPADYVLPEGVTAPEESLNNLKSIAKEAGMTQSQFEKSLVNLAKLEAEESERGRAAKESRDAEIAKKKEAIHPQDLLLVEEFISKKMPKAVADAILSNITEEGVMDAMKDLRAKVLDNRLSGMGATNPPSVSPSITDEDVEKARDEWNKQPNKIHLRDEYIHKATLLAEKKRAEKQK